MDEKELRKFLHTKLVAFEAAWVCYEQTGHYADCAEMQRTGEVWEAMGTVLSMVGYEDIVASVWKEVCGE